MARYRPASRKDHRPRDVGLAPVELAVDEIADAAKEEADRYRLDDDVGERQDRQLASASEEHDRQGDAERTAVERHPALPQIERLDRVLDVIDQIVEQHVADAAAEHDAKRRPDEEIVD